MTLTVDTPCRCGCPRGSHQLLEGACAECGACGGFSAKPVLVFADRYSATGTPHPDPATVCKGPCEGMGFYPDMERAAQEGLSASETPFVKCPDCNGTGKRPT